MLGVVLLGAGITAVLFRLFILPIIIYLLDRKGFRNYPNYSWLSPLTDLRHCYLSSQGSRSKDLTEEHVRRGEPILRIGPNALAFNHPDAIKDIYGHRAKCTKDLKESVLAGDHRNLFDVVEKGDHGRKRKLLSAAFAAKNLENWEYKVQFTTQRLLNAFDTHCTPPLKSNEIPASQDLTIDFNHWINLWTIEAINYIAISATMDLLDTGTDEVTAEKPDGTLYRARYRHAQNSAAIAKSVFVWEYDLYPWLEWASKVIPRKWQKTWVDSEPWGDVCYHQASERLRRWQAGEKLDDFFSCLLEDKTGSPNNLEWGEIVAEVSAIIDAGADTTSIALTHVLDLLIKHPLQMQKLRAEIAAVLDEGEEVAPYDKIKDLPYLKACLDEGLRLIPPVSAGLPRRTPLEGAQILGKWIPGDTSVSMTIWGAHHNGDLFPDPEAFKPERWLDPEERRRMEPFFIPFTTGARGCIGRNISYLEQQVVLASLVHRYDFALPTVDFELKRFEAFNLIVGPMPIKIWRREA
ncbi:cytochrome P450 [Dactylonectria estremocensis]|uniref:Cytochrome P450 n=1 Tax=Dactylonectria estremocensis TaxID=1079267 RepID=A0A9P9D7G6_9HYPO|nr:cytochrome P450 [Dactylonectria estremocensis]